MNVSVIMTALDEPYVNRTIDDVIRNSSIGTKLKEIIVIDDLSAEKIYHPDAKIIRNTERKGLIWGRQEASRIATGDIIVSLDPHCKVSGGWLSVISSKLEEDYKCIAVPLTKMLDPYTWEDINPTQKGLKTSWNWQLDFNWVNSPGRDTPSMAGHCFAYTKKWWEESGGFDADMKVWGGENIEFSLRTWLLGGSVQLINCWVSHWFKKKFQYKSGSDTLLHNKSRLVEVWFDEYTDMFYKTLGRKRGSINYGDIRERLRLKYQKQERSMDWFVKKFKGDLYEAQSVINKKNIDTSYV